MDNEIDRKRYVTAILFPLVQNRHQTHDWTLIGSGANGLGIQESPLCKYKLKLWVSLSKQYVEFTQKGLEHVKSLFKNR